MIVKYALQLPIPRDNCEINSQDVIDKYFKPALNRLEADMPDNKRLIAVHVVCYVQDYDTPPSLRKQEF